MIVVGLVNFIVFAAVVYFLHGPDLNYWTGFEQISEYWKTPFESLSIVILIPILIYYYLQAIGLTLLGIVKGRRRTQKEWVKIVARHVK